MKTILVPIEPHDAIQSVLETALLLARKFDGFIEGFALRPAIGNLVTMDPVSSLTVVSARENDAEIVKQARGIFETFMRDKAVPGWNAGTAAASQSWLEATPDGDEVVGSYGRVFDITVLGAPTGSRQGPRMMTLETALFESGRPVLLAPPTAPRTLGETVLLAWNCSTEQARATTFAMPLLRKSARVVVCTVEGATVPGPTGDQITRYLRMHKVPAEAITINPAPMKPGEAIMAKARELGCDLVVKGAYTQSRLRQMIFGGTTQYILTHATLPVLLAH
jgi:nucleotide-binding universal stress UspA family protein